MTRDHPDLAVRLEVNASLSFCADASNPMNARVRESVERAIGELLANFGIPARPAVSITVCDGSGGGTPFGLSVGEVRVRYPIELLQRVYSYVRDEPLNPQVTRDKIAEWLSESFGTDPHSEVSTGLEFLSLACAAILSRDPALLFGPEQAGAFAALLPWPVRRDEQTPQGPLDSRWVGEVLRPVLVLGISVADRQAVANVLATARPGSRPPIAITEDLVAILRSDVIEIQAPRAFLQELTTGGDGDGPGMFPFLREGLFEELGIELPRLRFVIVETLKPRTFSFRVNHVASLPLRGLDPNQLLVNDTAERLGLAGIRGVPTINPATWQPGSLIDAGAGDHAQRLGLTTWNPLQHVVLCLAAHVRQDGHALVHRAWVQERLQKLRLALPTLLATARDRWSDDEITGVVRDLVRDGVSVRNLPRILERLIELDRARKESVTTHAWYAPALEHPLAFVRMGVGRDIANKAGRQTNTVVVYLLDPAIERLVADSPTLLGDDADRILRAFHAELAYLPPTAQTPHILTRMETRRAVQDLVRSEFPRLSVIAHEELPPGTNVQPVARISMA